MSESAKSLPPSEASSAIPADTVAPKTASPRREGGGFFALRKPIPQWLSLLFGATCILFVLALWWALTAGEQSEDRILSYTTLPSPAETFSGEKLHELWFDNALTRNLFASLRRVIFGFGLAAAIGVPLGVLCGCYPWVNAFFAPMNVFGRNIPIAALIPLTFALFGTGEFQKVMFIFIAAAAFVMMDTATAVADVSSRYIDTAYTLGANRRQIVLKVLVPLAMPRVFNSLRLLFGLAFGYIMLAELIKSGEEAGGLGSVINTAQRLGHRETILLILIVIPAVALGIDRLVYFAQRSLFPYQYGGNGVLHDAWRGLMHSLEGVKQMFLTPKPLAPSQAALIAPKVLETSKTTSAN